MKRLAILTVVLVMFVGFTSAQYTFDQTFNSGNTGICTTYNSGGDECVIDSSRYYRGQNIELDFTTVSGNGAIITAGNSENDGGVIQINADSVEGSLNIDTGGGNGQDAWGDNDGTSAGVGKDIVINSNGAVNLQKVDSSGGNGGDASGCCDYDGGAGGNAGDITLTGTDIAVTNGIEATGGSGGEGVSCCGNGGSGGTAGTVTITGNSLTTDHLYSSGGNAGGAGYDGWGRDGGNAKNINLDVSGPVTITNELLSRGGKGGSGNPDGSEGNSGTISFNGTDYTGQTISTAVKNRFDRGTGGTILFDIDTMDVDTISTNFGGTTNINALMLDVLGGNTVFNAASSTANLYLSGINLDGSNDLIVNADSGEVNLYYANLYDIADSQIDITVNSGNKNVGIVTLPQPYMYLFQGKLSNGGSPVGTGSMRIKVKDSDGDVVWGPYNYNDALTNGNFAVVLGKSNKMSLMPGRTYYIEVDVDEGAASYSTSDVTFGQTLTAMDGIPFLPS